MIILGHSHCSFIQTVGVGGGGRSLQMTSSRSLSLPSKEEMHLFRGDEINCCSVCCQAPSMSLQ